MLTSSDLLTSPSANWKFFMVTLMNFAFPYTQATNKATQYAS